MKRNGSIRVELTAGNAKNEIAKTLKQDATNFPIQVLGTASPYPMVVTVICQNNIKKS